MLSVDSLISMDSRDVAYRNGQAFPFDVAKPRNLVAHSADLSEQGDELRAVVEELVPAMEELDPRFQSGR
jgi:hypothetical protein